MKATAAYLLHLADNAVVLGQRNSEWCGHGPILEEDIALANMSLDMIGQARLLYQLAARRIGGDASEDRLAYFRDASEYRNYTLLELPHNGPLVGYAVADRDYATTTVRNFLYGALMVLLWDGLQKSADEDLAAIAAKSLKEASYHRHCARDTLVPVNSVAEGLQQDFDKTASFLVRLRLWHPVLSILTGVYLLFLARLINSEHADPTVTRLSRLLAIFVVVQLAAGFVNVMLLAPVWMQVIHLLLADLVWLSLVLLSASVAAVPVPKFDVAAQQAL